MTTTPNAVRYWNREPAVLRCSAPVDLDRAYAAVVAASEPFRVGTRFFALPDVRFLVGRGRLRAPGDLLPADTDATVRDYQDRLDARLADEGYLLLVEQPLMLDFALWQGVRDAVGGLWRQVGWPNLPLVTELVVADRYTGSDPGMRRAGHATLAWVLRGTLHIRLAGGALRAGPGELVHLPADVPHGIGYADRCVVLYLRVPVDPSLADAAVRRLVAGMMEGERDDSVPYLRTEDVPELKVVAEQFRQAVDSAALARLMRIRWAVCRSAGGLEPVPPPRSPDELAPGTVLRRRNEVVRLPDGPGRWLWVVNGHAFPVAGTGGDRVLAALVPEHGIEVGELSRAVSGQERSAGVVALLRRLHAVRGVDVVDRG